MYFSIFAAATEGQLLSVDFVQSEGFFHLRMDAVSPPFHKFGLTLAAAAVF